MKGAIVVALGLLVARASIVAETGFLDRAVTVGAVTYRYQVYVPAEHTRARSWPVIVDLHGGGSQGSDGLRQTAQGLSQQIRLNRSRFPVVVVFPQAAVGNWWLNGDMQEAAAQESNLPKAMATPLPIFPGIIAGATRVGDCFLLDSRRPDCGQ